MAISDATLVLSGTNNNVGIAAGDGCVIEMYSTSGDAKIGGLSGIFWEGLSIRLRNIGNYPIIFNNNDSGSEPQFRLNFGKTITLEPKSSLDIIYNKNRWERK